VVEGFALCEDLIAIKRSVEQLSPLADEVPSVARTRNAIHTCYLSERGLPEEALARYGAMFESIDRERPTLRDVQYLGAYARILRKAGQARRARDVCEAALRALTPEERETTLIGGVPTPAVPVTWPGRNAAAFVLMPPAIGSHDPIGALLVLEEERPLGALDASLLTQLAESIFQASVGVG
jgi:hypothetical protein